MADIGADIVAQIVDDGHHRPLITRLPKPVVHTIQTHIGSHQRFPSEFT